MFNPKSLRQFARENKEKGKNMINSFYFTDIVLQVEFNIFLDSHHINHVNSKIIFKPNSPYFGIETRYTKKILIEMAVIYAGKVNQT